MRRSLALFTGLFTAMALTGVACGPIEVDPDRRGQTIIPRSGKADNGLTCKNVCGKQAAGGCWCDDLCATFGDCCADKSALCDKRPGSCQGACGKKSPDGCWCDNLCATYSDCCPDKASLCDAGPTCTKNAECKSTEFCEFAKGACLSPAMNVLQGSCKARPLDCTEDCPGVCGCDGKTYCNACGATAAGVSVAKDGACASDPCAAMDAAGVGECALFLGSAWDGKACLGLSGCSCSGKDCGKLHSAQAACAAAHATCQPACTQDADCRVFADYCVDVCACVPLGLSDPDPTCSSGMCRTLVALCQDKIAACDVKSGTCVVKTK